MTITIRQAGVGDVEALVVLNCFLQELHVTHRPGRFKQADGISVADWFSSMLRNTAADVNDWALQAGVNTRFRKLEFAAK
jgi:hypothetical protein